MTGFNLPSIASLTPFTTWVTKLHTSFQIFLTALRKFSFVFHKATIPAINIPITIIQGEKGSLVTSVFHKPLTAPANCLIAVIGLVISVPKNLTATPIPRKDATTARCANCDALRNSNKGFRAYVSTHAPKRVINPKARVNTLCNAPQIIPGNALNAPAISPGRLRNTPKAVESNAGRFRINPINGVNAIRTKRKARLPVCPINRRNVIIQTLQ